MMGITHFLTILVIEVNYLKLKEMYFRVQERMLSHDISRDVQNKVFFSSNLTGISTFLPDILTNVK